jgi:hypothetical protein
MPSMPMQVATNLIARLGEWDVSITTEPFPFQVNQKHQQIGIKLAKGTVSREEFFLKT